MTTAGPAAQTSTTVNAQDVRVFSLGPHAGELEAHAAVPGLGNVTATSVTVPPSASQQMLVVVTGGVKPTGGWQIDVVKVVVDGKNCVVVWQLTPPKGVATQAFTHPALVALVDRCDGTVEFGVVGAPKKVEPPAKEPR